MVQLVELIPDPGDVIALEPEELGLRMLPVLASIRHPLPPLTPIASSPRPSATISRKDIQAAIPKIVVVSSR